MIPEIGHFCLILAFLMSGAQAFLIPVEIRARCAKLIFVLLAISFFSLMWCYVTSDFTVANVASNSHTLKPMIYKISGVWSNHEGSMLLWVLILGLFGFIMARDKAIDKTLQTDALRIQGFLAFGFLSFILFTSNPFERLSLPPIDGAGLNPILQDIGLAVHPPLLYTGYVGFSAVFSLALAALLRGQMDRKWARTARSYTLCAWMALSGGIALGSWWAYYELGWGGWWFWDPVENASLMPWLLGTALLHTVLVLEKREGLKKWTALLAILTFSLSMLGTFLVRSGVLTSVHAFASDPARGIFILCLLSIFTGGALLAFALRANTLDSPDMRFSPLSRESSLIFNNLFMLTACTTVLIGTLYPLLLDALDMGSISVGAPYFNTTLVPLMLPALFLMGLAPYLAWKKATFQGFLYRLQTPAILTLSGTVLIIFFTIQKDALVFTVLLFALWLFCTTLHEWILACQMGKRIFSLPFEHHGMSLAHLGMAVAVFGMAGSTVWLAEDIRVMKPGQSMDIGRYTLHFESISADFGENYIADTAHFDVTKFSASQKLITLAPQRRYYPVAAQTTTEAAIYTSWSDDLYVAIGENQKTSKTEWIVRAYVHPLIPCLWTGFVMIASGGLISFIGTQRRKHAGA